MARAVGIFVITWGLASIAAAQSPGIELLIDTRTLEVGEAVDIQLVCTNTGSPSVPQADTVEGLELQLLNSHPSTNSHVSISGGRRWQQTTYTYHMRITAKKRGKHKLGPISVEANGRTYRTEPVFIVVKKGETRQGKRGDRDMFVEIEIEPSSLYVTESFKATLTIGIRQVVINGTRYRLDLLKFLDGSSQLSIFRGSRLTTSDLTLTDSALQRHSYAVYRVEKQVRAEEVGKTVVGPVFLKMNYPTSLRRGFFGRQEVSRSRKVTARADAIVVEVNGPPESGRPPSFTGAIGRYKMQVGAKPLRVEQNQPVTLAIAITGSPVSGVAGPDLSKQAELVSRFEFVKEEPVGELEGRAKVFRRAIFPRQQGEQTIPPITWSYFDPRREEYVSLASEPINLTVDAPAASSTSVALVDIAQLEPNLTTLTVLSGGISPNYVDAALVLADQSFTLTTPYLTALLLPPIGWMFLTLTVRHRTRLRTDSGFARRRHARHRARSLMAKALRNGDSAAQLDGLARAVTGYLSDRFDLPPAQLTPTEVRDLLDTNAADAGLVDELCTFLETCEAARYAPSTLDEVSASGAATRVRGWIRRIERATR